MRERIAEKRRPTNVQVVAGVVGPRASRPAVRVDRREIAAGDADLGVRLHELDLPLESIGFGNVIGVHARDQRCLGAIEPAVGRGANAASRLAENDQPGVVVAGEQLDAAVVRAVVDDDQLDVAQGLAENAVDRRAQIGRRVAARHDDADARFLHDVWGRLAAGVDSVGDSLAAPLVDQKGPRVVPTGIVAGASVSVSADCAIAGLGASTDVTSGSATASPAAAPSFDMMSRRLIRIATGGAYSPSSRLAWRRSRRARWTIARSAGSDERSPGETVLELIRVSRVEPERQQAAMSLWRQVAGEARSFSARSGSCARTARGILDLIDGDRKT